MIGDGIPIAKSKRGKGPRGKRELRKIRAAREEAQRQTTSDRANALRKAGRGPEPDFSMIVHKGKVY